ncbi:MAG: hypothetical protein M3N93_02010 [Acidobacteriota bacterium]|nr:hypothetical protein [Acidobacteriota bacterium]
MDTLLHDDPAPLCGRTDFIEQIMANCRAGRLTVLSAESGLGVSSLLRRGLLPCLRREGAIAIVFNAWGGRFFASDLRETLAGEVRETADPQFFAQSETLDEMLERIRARTSKPAVILLDQFEDYVRCHSGSEVSDSFDAELAYAVAARKGIFVIGLQEHALPAFERLGQYIPNLLGFHVQLTPLTSAAAKEAVTADAKYRGMEIEPEALEALVSARVVAAAENQIHPFYLKVASGTLLDSEALLKSSRLRMATVEAQHGVDRIVLESLDTKIAELSSTHVELLFRWCNLLISAEKHRLSVTEKGLTDYAGKLNRFVPTLLPLLLENGILRSIDAAGVLRYEISRDCLTPILRDWWERREAAIVARRRALFRIRSISLAASAIMLTYVIWLLWKQG